MAKISLVNVGIEIGNTIIAYEPNSLSYTEGKGEQNVFAQANGSTIAEIVYENDAESKFSMFKLSVRPTEENIEFFNSIKATGVTTVRVFQLNGQFTRTMQDAFLTNDYEVLLQTDSPFELEFKGSAVV